METGYLSKGKDSRKGHKGLTQRSQSQAPTHLKQIQVTHPALRTLRLPYLTLREPSFYTKFRFNKSHLPEIYPPMISNLKIIIEKISN